MHGRQRGKLHRHLHRHRPETKFLRKSCKSKFDSTHTHNTIRSFFLIIRVRHIQAYVPSNFVRRPTTTKHPTFMSGSVDVDALYASLLAQAQHHTMPYGQNSAPQQPVGMSQSAIQKQLLEQQQLLANLQALVLQQQVAQQQKQQAAAMLGAASGRIPLHPNLPASSARPTPPPRPPQGPAPIWNQRAGRAVPPPPPAAPKIIAHPTFQPTSSPTNQRFWGQPSPPKSTMIPPPPAPRANQPAFMYKPPPPPSPPASISSRASCGDIVDQLPDEWEY